MSAYTRKEAHVLDHEEWLGYVQPVGLVVSIPAMLNAGAILNRNFGPGHARFLSALPTDRDGEPIPEIRDFAAFAKQIFEWTDDDLTPAPPEVEVVLTDYHETLRPTHVLREEKPQFGHILLIDELPFGTDLDKPAPHEDSRHWQASPQARFERLLRATGVPIGLLVNGSQIRMVYAPKGESSGYITFGVADMVRVAGRPIFAALHMLLCIERMYLGEEKTRLAAILADSRKYQNVVSTKLSGQVLEALYELLRGFQSADDATNNKLLRDTLKDNPHLVYSGLVTALLRLVFLLYAEDRGLISTDSVYTEHYSVGGLYNLLREDEGRYPDIMYQRFGAWARLLALFRLIHSGGSHANLRIPAREGYLFDPDRYLFLEGRRARQDRPAIPRVPDGTIFKVLSKLLILDGERLSYRSLDVEQIGSVYEAVMGFELHTAAGRSLAIRPKKKHGAPATINLEALLRVEPAKRTDWFKKSTDQDLTPKAAAALKAAATLDDLIAALDRKIATNVTPDPVPTGAMIFQPSDERRRSGSHYTPRSLTGPIVRHALEPVLKQLGPNPTPDQILSLKVCDPAMGSGAFLVEACRQMGDALVAAWQRHGEMPAIPLDEDELLHARRQVAQRCLYGVDKNPLAADLAKLSLWLATLAKDHPFTFLDHSLRHGDSLAGLTRKQIAAFHWLPAPQQTFLEQEIGKRIERVTVSRARILAAADSTPYAELQQKLEIAEQEMYWLRLAGDAVLAAFFAGDKTPKREQARRDLSGQLEQAIRKPGDFDLARPVEDAVAKLRARLAPFHWELEFPEVFRGGVFAMVGNPPFAGSTMLAQGVGSRYTDWLREGYVGSGGKCDLVAFFFRRSYELLRRSGTFGLLATKTIAQGDSRSSGLMPILASGGLIYRATRRLPWPGQAAVVVSVVHVAKQPSFEYRPVLDGQAVSRITSYLVHLGSDDEPTVLSENVGLAFLGSKPGAKGFVFGSKGGNISLSLIPELIRTDRNREVVRPYIGGDEFNSDPAFAPRRFIINFDEFSYDRASSYTEVFGLLKRQLGPSSEHPNWWQFARRGVSLYRAIGSLNRVLAISETCNLLAFGFMPNDRVFSNSLYVFALDQWQAFAICQSRIHERWVRAFASSFKDDQRYVGADCFDTFPFPRGWKQHEILERVGQLYYEYRADLMLRSNRGLTEIYNHFHDPDECDPETSKLRELHDAMDRAALDAYGWHDLAPTCEFIPEFEDEEDDEDTETGRPRRKRFRYRWPNEIRDEVLARLLELNRQRALQEGQIPVDAAPVKAEKVKKLRKARMEPELELVEEKES